MSNSGDKLLPCPFCDSAVMFRKALHISDGNVDSIIHATPTACGMVEFSDGSTDESIVATWNTRALRASAAPEEGIKLTGLSRSHRLSQKARHNDAANGC